MTRGEARQIALDFVKAMEADAGCELVLVDSRTIERNFGWIFFYQSKRHIETGNISDALAGNAPVVVTKADGRIHGTGTAHDIEYYLRKFKNI